MTQNSNSLDYFEITFVRHGESIGNANGYHQGRYDFPLSEKGISQANQLADFWLAQNRHFDSVISSPLTRASQTAEIIAHKLNVPLSFDPLWMERDAGVLSGVHHEEARQRFPRPDFLSLYDKIGRSGESQWQLFIRAGEAIDKLLALPPARYMIVSHGGILNMVMYVILGIFPQPNFYGAQFLFENTSYVELKFFPQTHNWLLISLQHPPYRWINQESD